MKQNILDVQKYLKDTHPFNLSFDGELSGELDQYTTDYLSKLNTKVQYKISDPANITKEELSKLIDNDNLSTPTNDDIKKVQQIINDNPFNVRYDGSVDGIMNDKLEQILIQLEDKISQTLSINAKERIVKNHSLVISSDELQKIFSLIKFYQNHVKNK